MTAICRILHEHYAVYASCEIADFVVSLALAVIATAFKRQWRPRLKLLAAFAVAAGLAVAGTTFASLPKTAVRLVRLPALRSQINLRELSYMFASECETNPVSSLSEARIAIKKIVDSFPRLTEKNLLIGGPVREEDSPGNYILRQSSNGVEIVCFDADGGEHLLNK